MVAAPVTGVVELTPRPDTMAPYDSGGVRRAEPGEQKPVDENVYLIGRPPLRHLLDFVRHHAVNPRGKGDLASTWQTAHEVVRRLEKDEAGLADDPPMGKLGPEYEALLVAFLQDPLVRHGFNTVPTDIAMVELDRLVVFQNHIDLTFARRLQRELGPAPSDEAVFRTCLPYHHPQPPVKWCAARRHKFVFVSPSNDLRFLGPMPLKPHHVKDYPPPGDLVGVIGIGIGFGSNFMNAIYAEKRLILNNGSHRAYALRKMGVTHVPCIVQHVSSRHELGLVASSRVRRRADAYLKHPRPPMLRDYFDPRLHLVIAVRRLLRQITVRFQVEQDDVPAL